MALAVARTQHQKGIVATSVAATFAGSTTVGNYAVAVVTAFSSGATTPSATGVTDNKGNTWTRNAFTTTAAGGGNWSAVYSAPITTGGTTHTVTFAEASMLIANLDLAEVSGQTTVGSPFDKSASNSATGVAYTTGSTGALAQADEIVFVGVGIDTGAIATVTEDATYTLIGEEQNGTDCVGNVAYKIVSATTAINHAWTTTFPSSPWAAIAATFKGVAAGPPTLGGLDATHLQTAAPITLSGLPFTPDNASHVVTSTTIALPSGLADDFNRANGALGGNWLFNAGALIIRSNMASRSNVAAGDSAVYNTSIGSTNQYVEADVGELVTFVTLALRTSPADRGNNFYEAYCEPISTTVRIAKTTGGAFTILNSNTAVAYTDPSHLRFEAEGSTLRLYVNGALAVTATDATLSTGTYAGFNIASGNLGTVDNWTAGTLLPTAINLTVDPAAHAQTADPIVLTVGTQLPVADANHVQTADPVTLTGIVVTLTVAPATHTQTTSDPFASVFPYPRSVSGRKFLDQGGNVYLLNDFSSWGMAQNLSNAEITQALSDVASRHFKSVAVAFCGVFIQNDWVRYQNKAGQNFWTGSPFVTNTAGSGFGAAWSSFDWIMSEATRLHLSVNVTFFISYGTTGIRADLEAAGNTNAYNFGFALATRYNAYRNKVWHVMGDTGWSATDAIGLRLDQVFRGITDASVSPRNLIVAEPYLGGTGYQMFISQQGLSPSGYQWLTLSANSVYDYDSNSVEGFDVVAAEDPSIPVFDSEPPYVGATHYTGIRTQQYRERNYSNVIRGGVGTNYGDESWWTFGKLGLFITGINWDQVVTETETIQAMYCWDLLELYCTDFTWVPDSSAVNATGLGSGDTKAAAGRSDTAMLVYFPSSRTGMTVNTQLVAGNGNVRLRWFDPTLNTYSTIALSEAQVAARSVSFPATVHQDGSTDWILVVDSPQLAADDATHAVSDSGPLTLAAFTGGTNLVVAPAAHATVDSGPLTLAGFPPAIPADASHNVTDSGPIVLTTAGVVTIVVANSSHVSTSSIIPLTIGAVTLTVSPASQAVTSTVINFAASGLPSHSTVTGDVFVDRTPPSFNVVVNTQFGD